MGVSENYGELKNTQKLLIVCSFLLLSGFKIITLLGSAILAWKSVYRFNYNARSLGSENMKFTPISSIIWGNVPIVGIWKCYQMIKELFYVSADTKNKNNSKANDRLCRVYLFSNIFVHLFYIYNICVTSSMKQDDLSIFSLPHITDIGTQISFLIMLIVTSLLINRIQKMQSEKQKIAYLTKEI